ncbi:FadR/GntR family transcriptional regulator [Aquibacillus saliphilus]|uniref:FadR/GntR family transcriptional regulator n=1 Tax=Aquibacillus saliphilus TaxID=1909422 RepID=UPI001CF0C875|nr:FadR/GntR family transcriptional regulator [Aquibacillus saliphilus]
MEEQKVKHMRLYEQVILQLERQYNEGQLKLGDTLPSERELVKLFDVSRGTLRDAFRVLESQGIIETKPGGGRYFRKGFHEAITNERSFFDVLQKAAMLDLLETREILETGMIELVCERATDEEIEKLERLVFLDKLPSNIKRENVDYYFHHSLAESSKNIVILNFIKLNLEVINQTRQKNFASLTNFEEAQREHIEIVKALKQRDAVLAKQKVTDHFIQIRKRLNCE